MCHYRGTECQRTVSMSRRTVHQSYHRVSWLRHLLQQCTKRRRAQCSAVFKDNSRKEVGTGSWASALHPSPSHLFPVTHLLRYTLSVLSCPRLFRVRRPSRSNCLLVVAVKLFLMASTLYWYVVFINFVHKAECSTHLQAQARWMNLRVWATVRWSSPASNRSHCCRNSLWGEALCRKSCFRLECWGLCWISLLDFREHGWCAVYLKPLNKELFL